MAVRGFARYLSAIDPRTQVPPVERERRVNMRLDAVLHVFNNAPNVIQSPPARTATALIKGTREANRANR